jgi:hypothetical protein
MSFVGHDDEIVGLAVLNNSTIASASLDKTIKV